jgi:hypothetical protein
MQVNILEAHDRLLELQKKQADIVSQGADDCLKRNPLSLALQDKSPYIYIFGHARTLGLDEKMKYFSTGRYATMADVPEKRILWQPRLLKPLAQTNSFLFRAQSKTDILEICWILPSRELWDQYEKDNVTESDIVRWSIHQFMHNKTELERDFPEDLHVKEATRIYQEIVQEQKVKIRAFKPILDDTKEISCPSLTI